MPLLILLLLIGLPLAEISVFIEVGDEIGAGNTILLTVATAVGGLAIARMQGFVVMARMQASMAQGQPPVGELVHGFFLFLGGVFLLIPGFLTDGVGVLLLLPPVRLLLGRAILRGTYARNMHTSASVRASVRSSANDNSGASPQDVGRGVERDVEIDGVFWEEDSGNEAEDSDEQDKLPTDAGRSSDRTKE